MIQKKWTLLLQACCIFLPVLILARPACIHDDLPVQEVSKTVLPTRTYTTKHQANDDRPGEGNHINFKYRRKRQVDVDTPSDDDPDSNQINENYNYFDNSTIDSIGDLFDNRTDLYENYTENYDFDNYTNSYEFDDDDDDHDDDEEEKAAEVINDLFQPIRIEVLFVDLDEQLTTVEADRLKHVVNTAKVFIQHALLVVPDGDTLYLPRDGCLKYWHEGVKNAGRCKNIDSLYSGKEECRIDNFKIPTEHLDELSEWTNNSSHPVRQTYYKGIGIENADYILYVKSITTRTCSSPSNNIMAYASFCKLGVNDRPVAGFLNVCPEHLSDQRYSESKARKTMIHEFFHALGFSKSLYDKFKECKLTGAGLKCLTRNKRNVVTNVFNANRVITPKHKEQVTNHFNCSVSKYAEFGAVLHTENGVPQSHWDPMFLQGSIMTPDIGLPHLSVVDNMTLAVFEDMGWYKVNYGVADQYNWGKNQGCYFGIPSTCNSIGHSEGYFCNGSSPGCHYMHINKASCSSTPFTGECRIYKAEPGSGCGITPGPDVFLNPNHAEKFLWTSRCFVANLTLSLPDAHPTNFSGRCYEHRCVRGEVQIQVGNSGWVVCPPGTNITVPGFDGLLECPLKGVLCGKPPWQPPVTTTTPKQTTPMAVTTEIISTTRKRDPDTAKNTRISLEFEADFDAVKAQGLLEEFKTSVINKVVNLTGLPRTRIKDVEAVKGSIKVNFVVLPSKEAKDGPYVNEAYSLLKEVVESGNFSVSYSGGEVFAAPLISKREVAAGVDPEKENEGESNGKMGGIVVGVVLGTLVLIGALVISVVLFNKYKAQRIQVQPRESPSNSISGDIEMGRRTTETNSTTRTQSANSTAISTRGVMISTIGSGFSQFEELPAI